MKFSLFKQYGALNSKKVFDAFEDSLLKAGHTVEYDDMHSDVAVIWSVLFQGKMAGNKPIWDYYRKTNRNVIVLEVGSINRNITWRVGLNGINRDSYYNSYNCNADRATSLGLTLKEWRNNGEYILICCQHDKSLQWRGKPETTVWLLEQIEQIRKYTDRPIIIRPHPRCSLKPFNQPKNVVIQDPKKVTGTYDSYDLNFSNIWLTVNYSSNPGIESIINGVPVYTDAISLAYDVSIKELSNIETPLMPDRQSWLNRYAWTEFTLDEIQQGIPLTRLTSRL
jgi:hypothetical protein